MVYFRGNATHGPTQKKQIHKSLIYKPMRKRIIALDYIRVAAILMILLCHYFLFSDLNSGIGRYLGRTGNIIFFLVSALLYGLKYIPDTKLGNCIGCKGFDCKSFTIRRIIKLGASVWPFLGFLIVLYVLKVT